MQPYVRTDDLARPLRPCPTIEVGADPRSANQICRELHPPRRLPVRRTTLSASERGQRIASITLASRATPLPLGPIAIMCPTAKPLLIPGSRSRGCSTLVARSRSKAGAHPVVPVEEDLIKFAALGVGTDVWCDLTGHRVDSADLHWPTLPLPKTSSVRFTRRARIRAPRRSRLRMSSRAILPLSLICSGSGCSGCALAMPWWGRCPL
jgi:hypothetical protein